MSAALPATYSISASGAAASVSGEQLRAGVYRGSVVGIEAGEVQITLRANHPGYTTATETFDVVVEDLFDLSLWRELVFDEYECPNGNSVEWCQDRWGGRDVKQRITTVLAFQPNFHFVNFGRDWRFTFGQERTLRDAISASVEQVTGEPFTGRITSGETFRDQYGWVDVLAAREEFWTERDLWAPCAAAWVGRTNGFIIINLDSLSDCDLERVMVHEVGHALGFFHVLDFGDYIMSPYLTSIPPEFSEAEAFHARLAWELGRGAHYAPDPRKESSSAEMTMSPSSPARREIRTLWDLPLDEMIQCSPH